MSGKSLEKSMNRVKKMFVCFFVSKLLCMANMASFLPPSIQISKYQIYHFCQIYQKKILSKYLFDQTIKNFKNTKIIFYFHLSTLIVATGLQTIQFLFKLMLSETFWSDSVTVHSYSISLTAEQRDTCHGDQICHEYQFLVA
jgi:hypothetical protein